MYILYTYIPICIFHLISKNRNYALSLPYTLSIYNVQILIENNFSKNQILQDNFCARICEVMTSHATYKLLFIAYKIINFYPLLYKTSINNSFNYSESFFDIKNHLLAVCIDVYVHIYIYSTYITMYVYVHMRTCTENITLNKYQIM